MGLYDHSYKVLELVSLGNLLFNKGGVLSTVDVENLTAML